MEFVYSKEYTLLNTLQMVASARHNIRVMNQSWGSSCNSECRGRLGAWYKVQY